MAALAGEGSLNRTSYLVNLSATPGRMQLTISVHTLTEASTATGVPELPAVQVIRALADALETVEAGAATTGNVWAAARCPSPHPASGCRPAEY